MAEHTDEKHEKTSDHAVMTFGRANPPTTGHAKLINHVKDLAKKEGADHHVFLSHTTDSKKNPLTHKQKREFLHKMVPHTNIHKEEDVKTPIDALKHLHKKGYKHVTVVVGGDRHAEMSNLVHKYNGKDYHFHKLEVKSAGDRDPDADGVEGMSASKMREHATKKDFKSFSKGVIKKEHAKELFHAVRKGLKLEDYQAVFLVGGPGSGKDFILRESLKFSGTELPLEKLSTAIEKKTDLKEINGGPLIINGNAEDGTRIVQAAEILEAMGYRTSMIYVYTSNTQSKDRNDQRILEGRNTISEEVRHAKYATSIDNMYSYVELFAEGFFLFDNSLELNEENKPQIDAYINELPTIVENYYKDMAKKGFHPMRADAPLPPPKETHPVPEGYERVKDGNFWKLRKLREDLNSLFETTIVDMIAKKEDTKGQKQGDKNKGGIAVAGANATEREVVEDFKQYGDQPHHYVGRHAKNSEGVDGTVIHVVPDHQGALLHVQQGDGSVRQAYAHNVRFIREENMTEGFFEVGHKVEVDHMGRNKHPKQGQTGHIIKQTSPPGNINLGSVHVKFADGSVHEINKASIIHVHEATNQEVEVPQTQAPGAHLDKKKPAKQAKSPMAPYNSVLGSVPSGSVGLSTTIGEGKSFTSLRKRK